MQTDRIIAFTSGGIGDQLYHFLQLQALAHFHQQKIDLVCRHAKIMAKIVSGCSWIGSVLDADPLRHVTKPVFFSAAKALSKERYSHSYVLHRSTSFKLASKLAGIPNIIGLPGSFLDQFLLDHLLKDEALSERRDLWGHRPFIAAIDEYLLARNLDITGPAPIQPDRQIFDKTAARLSSYMRPYTIINLFAQDISRRWAVPHAIQMLQKFMIDTGGTLFISAGTDANSWHQAFLSAWPDDLPVPILLKDKGFSLEQEIVLYHLADQYIGVDSFTANLAINCDLPALVLFNKKEDSLRYRPFVYALSPDDGLPIESISLTAFEQAVEGLKHLHDNKKQDIK